MCVWGETRHSWKHKTVAVEAAIGGALSVPADYGIGRSLGGLPPRYMYADGEERRSFDAAQRREKNNAARGVTIYKLFNGEALASLSWGGKALRRSSPPLKCVLFSFCVCV